MDGEEAVEEAKESPLCRQGDSRPLICEKGLSSTAGYSFFLRNRLLADTRKEAEKKEKEPLPPTEDGSTKLVPAPGGMATTRDAALCAPSPSLSFSLSSLDLEVKPSLILKAGQGLFTTVKRAKGSKVCVYEGTVLDTRTALGLSRKDYLMRLGPEVYVDARLHYRLPARYINDARDQEGSNLIFDKRPKEGKAVVYATRDIEPGEELYARYGGHYWDAHDVLFGTAGGGGG